MRKGFLPILLVAAMVLSMTSCSVNKAKIDNSLKKYFDSANVDGCFSFANNQSGEVTVYNIGLDTQRFLPASTFKIVNSLIGLETGRITDEKMVIKWDGVPRNPAWDKDLTMEEAFKVSAVPYYQEVARRIGKDTMQHWLDTLGYASRYGKAIIKTHIDSFWLDNSIKISADEELGLVKKLYFDQLPFQKRTQELVKKVMLQEQTPKYTLYYKTGWGFKEDGSGLGWIVGWIEENKHVYFFAMNMEGPHDINMVPIRRNALTGILKQLGFFEGKK